ncbi:MAG: hypothetical protein NTV24_04765 [Candidatus Woesebacteria bacterium]|nr:hypothetical protein [Candidatus Woesebacteria bacterium]
METLILTIREHKGATRHPQERASRSFRLFTGILPAFPGATFSNTHKSWWTEYNAENVKEIFLLFKVIAVIDASAVIGDERTKLSRTKF